MIRIIEEDSVFIHKYTFDIFEGYSVLSLIDTIFVFVPFKIDQESSKFRAKKAEPEVTFKP